MNPAEVRQLGADLQADAGKIDGFVEQVNRLVHRAGWGGGDAESFVGEWPVYRARLTGLAEDLRGFGQSAINNAEDQERASGGGNGAGEVRSLGSLVAGIGDEENRNPKGEIEIRQLANGRYVVVLPGVEDLSQGLTEGWQSLKKGDLLGAGEAVGRRWAAAGENGSIRDMGPAIVDALNPFGSNKYAESVKRAMEAAGVPKGSEVMIIGHSYGGYTAMDLAADRSFNSGEGSSGYKVTHVLSMGAATDHYLPAVPSSTNVLIANNRIDAAYTAEDGLFPDVPALSSNHVVREFVGGTKGAGHHTDNYAPWISGDHRFDPAVSRFISDAESKYGGPGHSTNQSVKR